MSQGDSRVCPECGAEKSATRRLEREKAELRDIRRAANNIARDYGNLRLENERLKYKNGEIQDRLQGKIYRQAKAIVRLEAKIRELGGLPHDDVPTAADAVGGAESERAPLDAVGKRAGWLA